MGPKVMTGRDERGEEEALLSWLRMPSPRTSDDDLAETIRRNLRSRKPARRGQRPTAPDDEVVRALLPTTRRAQRHDWDQARVWAMDWRAAKLEAEEVREWLAAGAAPNEGALVGMALLEGVTTKIAQQVYTHPDTGELLTALDIVRRTPLSWGRSWDELCDALDAAGVERKRIPWGQPRRGHGA